MPGKFLNIPLLLILFCFIFFIAGCGLTNPGSPTTYRLSWSNPLPQGNTLQSIVFIDADNAFAVGVKGSIIRYSSGSWTVVESNTREDLFKVWAYNANNVFAVGSNGTIMRFDGNSWSKMSQGLTTSILQAVWGFSPTDLYVGSNNGEILHYDGLEWTSSGQISAGYITGILGFSANNIYAISNQGEVLHYNGTSWSVSTILESNATWLTGIWADAENNIYVCATSVLGSLPNNVFHFDGTSWTGMGRAVNGGLNAIWGTSSNNLIVVGDYGLTARYDGSSWTDESLYSVHIYGIYGGSANNIFAVGNLGMILQNTGGSQWSLVSSPLVWDMRCIWGTSANNLFAGGSSGTILNFDGTEWTKIENTGVSDTIYGIWGTSDSNIYAVGGNTETNTGFIIHYDGTTWNTISDDLNFIPFAITGTAANDIYVAGSFVIRFNGTNWSDPFELPFTALTVCCTDDNVFVAGTNGGMMYVDKRRSSSRMDFSYINSGTCFTIESMFGFSSNNVFMGDAFGNLLTYDGNKWTVKVSMSTGDISGIWGTYSNNLYLIVGSDIMHFNGVSYEKITNIANYALSAVRGFSSGDIFFTGNNGTILKLGTSKSF